MIYHKEVPHVYKREKVCLTGPLVYYFSAEELYKFY